jgi:hypothetical protein
MPLSLTFRKAVILANSHFAPLALYKTKKISKIVGAIF